MRRTLGITLVAIMAIGFELEAVGISKAQYTYMIGVNGEIRFDPYGADVLFEIGPGSVWSCSHNSPHLRLTDIDIRSVYAGAGVVWYDTGSELVGLNAQTGDEFSRFEIYVEDEGILAVNPEGRPLVKVGDDFVILRGYVDEPDFINADPSSSLGG